MDELEKELEKLHQEACLAKKYTYKDPVTGHEVFTEFYLLERGYCCQNGCRHCPYGFNKKE